MPVFASDPYWTDCDHIETVTRSELSFISPYSCGVITGQHRYAS